MLALTWYGRVCQDTTTFTMKEHRDHVRNDEAWCSFNVSDARAPCYHIACREVGAALRCVHTGIPYCAVCLRSLVRWVSLPMCHTHQVVVLYAVYHCALCVRCFGRSYACASCHAPILDVNVALG